MDDTVGLDNTLIVLSSDHGGPDAPGYMNSLGVPAEFIEPDAWDSESAIARVKAEFQIEGELIASYNYPYLYLSDEVTSNHAIDQEALERAIAAEWMDFPGVSLAVSSTALRLGNVEDSDLIQSVMNNFHPQRSGDVYIVFEPNHFINEHGGVAVAAMHGSPWRYDTHVPIVFAGVGLEPQTIDRRVHTVDIAPTLSAILNIMAPSGSSGSVLHEVTD